MGIRIVATKKLPISGLKALNGTFNSVAYGYVLASKEWWQRKYEFFIQLYVPYLDKPFFDCEYCTNRILGSIRVQLQAETEQLRDKVERRYNRYIKIHK